MAFAGVGRRNPTGDTPLGKKTTIGLLSLMTAAMALRLVFCGFVVGFNRPPAGDEIDYHQIAENLSRGDGFRLENGELTARRPPLYPVVLASLYKSLGVSVARARILQVLLGTLIVLLVFLTARRFFTVGAAWVAAFFAAVNPFLIFISAYLLTENLYVVLLLAGVLVVGRSSPRASWWIAALGGVIFGLADLCRPTASLFALWIAAGGLLFAGGALRKRVIQSVVLVAAVFVTLLPWGARNHHVFHKWILSTTHGGITFYQGNNPAVLEYPQYYGGVAPLYMLPGYEALKSRPEVEKDKAAWVMGKSFLLDNMKKAPLLVWRKFVRFWRFRSDVGMSGVKSGWWWNKESRMGKIASSLDAGAVYAVFVIPLFVLGICMSLASGRRTLYLGGVVIVHTIVSLVFHGSLRMRLPVEPVMAMFAGDACWRLLTRLRMTRRAR